MTRETELNANSDSLESTRRGCEETEQGRRGPLGKEGAPSTCPHTPCAPAPLGYSLFQNCPLAFPRPGLCSCCFLHPEIPSPTPRSAGDCIFEKLGLSGTLSVPFRPNGSWLYPPHSSETSHLIDVRPGHAAPWGYLFLILDLSTIRC